MRRRLSGLNNHLNFALDYFKNKSRELFVFGACLAVFSGCTPTIDQICGSYASIDDKLVLALDQLNDPASQAQAMRKLASEDRGASGRSKKVEPRHLSDSDRQRWMNWAEKTLKGMEASREAFENDARRRSALKPLTQASLALVSLHGFVDQDKLWKAHREALKARSALKEAYALGCAIDRAPAAAPGR